MKKQGSFIYAMAVVITLLSVMSIMHSYFGHKFAAAQNAESSAILKSAFSTQQNASAAEETTNSASSSNEESKTENAVSASTSGQAIGKINASHISPESANFSFNNTYVKNSTETNVDLKSLLLSPVSFKIEKNGQPQVLIVHTHTTECYMNEKRDYYTADDASRSRDSSKNMVAIGNIIEQKLNAAGIGVIHDTTVHDYPSYSGSYTRAAKTIESDLAAYPSIKIVIDIHRDAIGGDGKDKTKPIATIGGKQVAQVMLVMGSETGGITGFPNWQENLKFALKYQQTMEVMYPGLARAMALNQGKYNENLTVGSILLEVGSDANHFSEAVDAAALAGNALVSLLNTMQ